MKAREVSIYPVLLMAVALLVAATPALAQSPPWISYAAKFVCKAQSGSDLSSPGKYRTVVNIHNPHNLVDEAGAPLPLQFFKKVVLAKPQGQAPFPPSCHLEERLESDWALAVDCNNIIAQLGLSGLPTAGLLDGFVVIEVPPFQGVQTSEAPSLDVVAVYTGRPRTGTDPDVKRYDLRTMDVERVLSTNIIGNPNIDLCLPD